MELGIPELIGKKENQCLEFKTAEKKLPSDLWETISAFANSKGGKIYLGVSEKNNNGIATEIVGVENVTRLIQYFRNDLNNPKKINCSEGIRSRIINYPDSSSKGKNIIEISVDEASTLVKPIYINNNPKLAYRRFENDEGDRLCSTQILEQFQRDKLTAKQQNLDIPLENYHAPWDNWLNQKTINHYFEIYNSIRENKRDNLLPLLNDLKSCQAKLEKENIIILNPRTNSFNLSVSGFLCFGIHNRLLVRFSYFKLDYQEFLEEEQIRPNFRIDTDSDEDRPDNIFDFFKQVNSRFEELTQPKRDSFVIDEHGQRQSNLEYRILREALVNTLIHCDYQINAKVLIRRYPNKIIFENPGSILTEKNNLFKANIKPIHRNPSLVKLFRKINYGEEAGAGLADIKKWSDLLSLSEPEIYEVFEPGAQHYVATKLIVYLEQNPEYKSAKQEPGQTYKKNLNIENLETLSSKGKAKRSDIEAAILEICANDFMTAKEIASLLNRNPQALKKNYIYKLVNESRLETKYPSSKATRNQAYKTVKALPETF